MDLYPSHTWKDLCDLATNRPSWRARVKALRVGMVSRMMDPDQTQCHHYHTRDKTVSAKPPTTQITVDATTITAAKPKTTSSRKRTAAHSAAQYPRRDVYELFFRRLSGGSKRRRQRTNPSRKRKKSSWTDAQRAVFAREHYARNHGTSGRPPATPKDEPIIPPPTSTPVSWTPPQILGHHHHHPDVNTTVTPIQWEDLFNYSPEADRKVLRDISDLCDSSPPPPSSPPISWTPPPILDHHPQNHNVNTTVAPIQWNDFANYSPDADRKRLQDISKLCP